MSSMNGRTVWLVVPLFVIMALGFDLPLIMMLARGFAGKHGLTLDHFLEVFQVPAFVKVFATTLRIAAVTSLLCVVLGYPLAYWLRLQGPRRQVIGLSLVIVPFWISILVRTYAWIVVLGNAGIVNRSLQALGWLSEPYSFLYNELGVVIGTVNVMLPFLVLPLFAAMSKIDVRLLQAAETLGAGRWTVFWRVFFPLSLPALAAGAVLVFILALGFYITPAILGGGRVPMIANMLDLFVNQMPNWDLASAISSILLVLTLALFIVYLRLTQVRDPI